MPNRRALSIVFLALFAAVCLPAMRQDITPDELDLRTIENKQRIAQLELELAALRAEIEDIRDTCCAQSDPQPAPATPAKPSVHDPVTIPPHANGAYYFRLTAITELEKDKSLLDQAKALEEFAEKYRLEADKGYSGARKLSKNEIRQRITDAVDYETNAKKLRLKYNNPGFALAGFDADRRDVTCNVTGANATAASRIPYESIVRARGEIIENSAITLILNNARVGRVREKD